jgi:hypothetical protein
MIDVVLDVSGIYGLGPSHDVVNLAAANANAGTRSNSEELVGTLISQAPSAGESEDEMVDPDSAYDTESASVIRLSNGMVRGTTHMLRLWPLMSL